MNAEITGPIIDMHGHQGASSRFKMWRSSVPNMIKEMDRHGVETLVMSPHKAFPMPDANYETPQVLAEAKGRLLAYWVAHPWHTETLKNQIDFLEQQTGFVGLKFHAGWHEYPLEGERYAPYWEYADRRGIIALVHTWGGAPYCGFDHCKAIADRYHNVRIIFGHSGYHEHERFAVLARDHANVFLDICAVGSLNGAIEAMVRIAGSHKIVLGTDLPWFDPGFLIGTVRFSRISDNDKRNILYNNARKLIQAVAGVRS